MSRRLALNSASGATVLAALLWGFAEATVFFIVPDVLLTLIAQRAGLRAALVATGFAVLGACAGGLVMWHLGSHYPAETLAALDMVPAVSPEMVARARTSLAAAPFDALLAGAFSGIPYKVFAGTAASGGVSASALLLFTIPARAARFLFAVAATVLLDRAILRDVPELARRRILIGFWLAFYAVYFFLMPH
jgi:membrane protein YqaA with SNARE-associated domain